MGEEHDEENGLSGSRCACVEGLSLVDSRAWQ